MIPGFPGYFQVVDTLIWNQKIKKIKNNEIQVKNIHEPIEELLILSEKVQYSRKYLTVGLEALLPDLVKHFLHIS